MSYQNPSLRVKIENSVLTKIHSPLNINKKIAKPLEKISSFKNKQNNNFNEPDSEVN